VRLVDKTPNALWLRLTGAGFIAIALVLGLRGIGRSLWLDEAWVANSIAAPSLGGMFYYPAWLQSSPPMFLLASRLAVRALGPSNAAFRAVPLLMALAATGGMFAAARRVLSWPFAALASTLLVFFTAEIEYSHSAKQYSGEVAATVFILLAAIRYLQKPEPRRACWLAAAFAFALPFSYAAVFLLPGVFVAMGKGRRLKMAVLPALVLLVLYALLIRPNFGEGLRAYWASESDSGLSWGTAAALVAAVAVTAVSLARARGKPGWREWTQIVCVLPCILLVVAGALGWYPQTYRTRLFVFPCYVLAVLAGLEDFARALFGRRAAEAGALLAAGVVAAIGVRAQIHTDPNRPKEDVDGAVSHLQRIVSAEDLLLIHPSVGESFRLYARLHHWMTPPAIYGETGWPCCPRGRLVKARSSTRRSVIADENRMVPAAYSGRVFLLYTIRPTHWDWAGLDESNVWRDNLVDRGCVLPKPDLRFENLAITFAVCGEKL
jgi:Dolichyl-phosphate-mannose-protein mannosyltransferase